VSELRRCSGTQFDPRVIDALIEVLAVDEPGLELRAAA
jgi:HD-GYP domain-containing protein (c-di-GMP phosphodiesterase class II)